MTFLATQRNIESFHKKILPKAKNTQRGILHTLKKFDVFCKEHFERSLEEVIQEMKKADREAIYDTLQIWINWIDSPNSIRQYFSQLNLYLYYRGITITPLDVKMNLDFGKKHQEEMYPLSQEEYRMILDSASYKNKVLYLLIGSSGMRPVEATHIRKCDLELDKKRIVIHVPAKWTKLKRAKTTFASREVSQLIKPILDKATDTEYLFPYSSTPALDTVFARYRKKTGLDKRYESNNVGKITPMSLRAWFITKISDHNVNLAKKWSGQKGYLLQYDRKTQEEQLEKYLEFEDDLLVYEQKKPTPNRDYKALEDKLYRFEQAFEEERSERAMDKTKYEKHMAELWKMYEKITKPRSKPVWGSIRSLNP